MNLKEKRELQHEERKEFAFYIKSHRESLGMTQKEFADALGVDWRTYNRYEGAYKLPHRLDDFIMKLREVVKSNRA